MTNDEVRAALRKTPLGNLIGDRKTEHPYYHAVKVLDQKGVIFYHNRRLYSPEAYEKFIDEVKSGETEDTAAVPAAHYSPMSEAIIELIKASV